MMHALSPLHLIIPSSMNPGLRMSLFLSSLYLLYHIGTLERDAYGRNLEWSGYESCYQWSTDMNIIVYFCHMKIEEAIVYCLATSNRGMRSEQIADMINRQQLHLRKDGQPVSAKQVFYVVTHAPHTFCLAEGRIMLMM